MNEYTLIPAKPKAFSKNLVFFCHKKTNLLFYQHLSLYKKESSFSELNFLILQAVF